MRRINTLVILGWVAMAAAGCTKRNPDVCCETKAECDTVGFSTPAPCDDGVCVNYSCAATGCDGDEDCRDASKPMCVSGQCYGAADACLQGGGAQVLFISNRSGMTEVYRSYVNGEGVVRLTHSDASTSVSYAVPSPDGQRIAYVNNKNIFTMDIDGGDIRQLTSEGTDVNARWSPDGTMLAVSPESWSDMSAYTMRSDGGQRHLLLVSGFSTSEPAWSPDSTMVAFVAAGLLNSASDLWIANAAGTVERRLLQAGSTSISGLLSPVWNPRGGSVALIIPDDNMLGATNTPWVKSLDATPESVLANIQFPAWEISWSHDGLRMVIVMANSSGSLSEDEPHGQIMAIINADGSNIKYTSTGKHPRWSPDDKYIYFEDSSVAGDRDIYRMDSDGSNVTNISNRVGDDFGAEWLMCPS